MQQSAEPQKNFQMFFQTSTYSCFLDFFKCLAYFNKEFKKHGALFADLNRVFGVLSLQLASAVYFPTQRSTPNSLIRGAANQSPGAPRLSTTGLPDSTFKFM